MTATLLDTAQNVPVFGVILVRIFPTFPHIWTEYGEILRMSPYSVQMPEKCGPEKLRIRALFTQWDALSIRTRVNFFWSASKRLMASMCFRIGLNFNYR